MPEDRRDFLKAGLAPAASVGLIGIPLAVGRRNLSKGPSRKTCHREDR